MGNAGGMVELGPRHERADDDLHGEKVQCCLPYPADHAVSLFLTPREECDVAGGEGPDDNHVAMPHVDIGVEFTRHDCAVA